MNPLHTRRGTFHVAVDGDTAAPALLLSNSLGTTLSLWAAQAIALSARYRVIRYDTRGHGASPVTPGPYSLEELGADVLAILDALDIERTAFCGISLGGHTGLWLGIHAGDRVSALAVCNSAAQIGTPAAWRARANQVRRDGAAGMRELATSAPERWFTPDFIQTHADIVHQAQAGMAAIDPQGYAACCDALAASDLRADVRRIQTPTLLVAGAFDPVTTVADAQAMQAQIAGARLAVLATSHLSNLQAPDAFKQTLLDFLDTTVAPR